MRMSLSTSSERINAGKRGRYSHCALSGIATGPRT
jgi:hypothetical protein